MATSLTINLSHTLADTRDVYATIIGTSPNGLFLLESDGQTAYYPTDPGSGGGPLQNNCAIAIAQGTTVTATVPPLAGARIYFGIGSPLVFSLNQGPALVEPSVNNPSDPNINLQWDFMEFSFSSGNVFANITYVDFVCFNIGFQFTLPDNSTQSVPGLSAGSPVSDTYALDSISSALQSQQTSDGQSWGNLIVNDSNGNLLRILSPSSAISTNNSLFANYFEPYVSQVWSQYANAQLSIDTQSGAGVVTGTVQNGVLTCSDGSTFTAPATQDIISCSSGPFQCGSDPTTNSIIPRLAAAFNRSTLLIDGGSEPFAAYSSSGAGQYYTTNPTNHYSRILHATEQGGRGYAFPYDDVVSDGGGDQAGCLSAPAVNSMSVWVGAGSSVSSAIGLKAQEKRSVS